MKWQNQFLFACFWTACTLVQASEVVEEVSYDDLVNQLNKKKTSIMRRSSDPLNDLQLHAGFGLITSANNVNTGGARDVLKYQNGFQLSLGIDLFSPHWVAETALRNFGQARSGTESRSLREFDLKILHRDFFNQKSGFRVGAGIGNRYLKIDDAPNGIDIDDNTPTALFFGGLETSINKSLSLGVEAGLRTSMINQTADRNAIDLTVRLDTFF